MIMDDQSKQPTSEARGTIESRGQKSNQLHQWWFLVLALGPIVASAFFAMSDAKAPPLAIQGERPALVFDTYLIDTGPDPVRSQPVITTQFTFTNRGDDTVHIREVVPGCTCVKPQATITEIPPGESGRILVPLDTRREPSGPREYIVNVRYEDPNPREVTLSCKVVLPEKVVELEPRALMVMGRITSADKDIVTILDYRPERVGNPMKIKAVSSSISVVTAQSAGMVEKDGAVRQGIEVGYVDHMPLGNHKGVVTVETDDAQFPVLQFPVILGGRSRPKDEPVDIIPAEAGRIIFTPDNISAATSNGVQVKVPSKWKVTHFECFPTAITATVGKTEELPDGRSLLTIEMSLSEVPTNGLERGTVTLHAKDGDEDEMVTMPVQLIRRSIEPEQPGA